MAHNWAEPTNNPDLSTEERFRRALEALRHLMQAVKAASAAAVAIRKELGVEELRQLYLARESMNAAARLLESITLTTSNDTERAR